MSKFRRLLLAVGAACCTVAPASAQDSWAENYAPFWVDHEEAGGLPAYERVVGPFFEHRAGTRELTALRPFYVDIEDKDHEVSHTYSLYPFFASWRRDYGHQWRVLSLMIGGHTELPGEDIWRFELWPFFWYYDTGEAESSYIAQFPLGGTLKNRLFHKRIDWVLFPLYVRQEQRNHVDHSVLWPIFRLRTGDTAGGAAVWPLFGHFERAADYDRTFALWPLIYNNYDYSTRIAGETYHALGVLPLYAQETGSGLVSRTFLWPFFGYTFQDAPRPHYREGRFLYPFFVQGRGDEKYVNRWLPFYTHETRPGYEKHWYLWPLLKTEDEEIGAVHVDSTRLLYFLYKDDRQSAASKPGWSARSTHLWPLFSYKDNGEGRRQFQTLSPLEPFFPGNEAIQQTWNPFFALYRYSGTPQLSRHSVLWDLVLWERGADGSLLQFGPLYERERSAGEGSRWSILKGLFSVEHETAGSTHVGALWGLVD